MQSGHLLRNRYRIENRLSAGGFGETYIAIDEDYPDKRRVVVKHLKPQSNDPAILDIARRLFEAEAATLAKLGEKTDLIPTLYAYFEKIRSLSSPGIYRRANSVSRTRYSKILPNRDAQNCPRNFSCASRSSHQKDRSPRS